MDDILNSRKIQVHNHPTNHTIIDFLQLQKHQLDLINIDDVAEIIVGPITFKNQNNEKFWTVGQWQGGKFYGVNSTGRPGAKPVKIKSGW